MWQLPPSPLEEITLPLTRAAGVRLFCKRDDLYTPAPGTALQGNKVRKLEPFLRDALSSAGLPVLVTFGGAYSNHLAALATAGRQFDLTTHLIVRGEEVDNPVLRYCAAAGAMIERISRSEYRLRNSRVWLEQLRARLAVQYGRALTDVWLIPEGGTSHASARNVGKVYDEIADQLAAPPDYVTISAGTGGSAAGIIQAADRATTVEVYPALKGDWMAGEIVKLLNSGNRVAWSCITGYHCGGYGRYPAGWKTTSPGLATRADIGICGLPPLEPVYTAKLFTGVLDRIENGRYPPGSTVVVIHTGGIY